MADALREDDDYIQQEAIRILHTTPSYKLRYVLRDAHPALAKRAIRLLHRATVRSRDAISAELLEAVYRAICSDAIYEVLTLPADVRAYIDAGYFYCISASETPEYCTCKLEYGVFEDKSRACALIISDKPLEMRSVSLQNVYNFVTHQTFASDTIKGSLFIRARRAGDAYTFGGISHRVNTLFTDAHLPRIERARTPILCDETGILWVPPFGPRDASRASCGQKLTYVYYLSRPEETEYEF
jgi:tRNA(Ile)-lysidine synthetase-like protein